jgi:carboxyl-terminal processing protease
LESLDKDKGDFKPVKEADLSHHLEKIKSADDDKKDEIDQEKKKEQPTEDNPSDDSNKDKESTDDKKDDLSKTTVDTKDYPLYEALNLLKGISIMRK